MMSKHKQQFEGQLDNEEVLLVFRRHPIVMRKGLIVVLVFILAGAIAGTFMSSNTIEATDFFIAFFKPILLGLALGLVFFSYFWIGWYFTVTIVTNERLLQIHQEGIFKRRSVNDIDLNRILSINYEQRGLLENVLGFGTIIVQTLVGDLVVHKIGHPARRQREMITAIKESGVELDEKTEAAIN
jgi:hypothetical protein